MNIHTFIDQNSSPSTLQGDTTKAARPLLDDSTLKRGSTKQSSLAKSSKNLYGTKDSNFEIKIRNQLETSSRNHYDPQKDSIRIKKRPETKQEVRTTELKHMRGKSEPRSEKKRPAPFKSPTAMSKPEKMLVVEHI